MLRNQHEQEPSKENTKTRTSPGNFTRIFPRNRTHYPTTQPPFTPPPVPPSLVSLPTRDSQQSSGDKKRNCLVSWLLETKLSSRVLAPRNETVFSCLGSSKSAFQTATATPPRDGVSSELSRNRTWPKPTPKTLEWILEKEHGEVPGVEHVQKGLLLAHNVGSKLPRI
jgi:hypothetical protein